MNNAGHAQTLQSYIHRVFDSANVGNEGAGPYKASLGCQYLTKAIAAAIWEGITIPQWYLETPKA